jgi:hypothetical protein
MLEEKRQQRRQQRRQQPLRRPNKQKNPQHERLSRARSAATDLPTSRLIYHEHLLELASGRATAESLANGHSVLVVPSFATPSECYTLIDAADAVVKYRRHSLTGEHEIVNETRSWTSTSNARNLVRLNVAKRLDAVSCEVSRVLVARALSLLECQLPHAAATIFKLAPSAQLTDVRIRLTFSDREPAVNVYTAGGDFQQHEDKKAFTVLVPISDPSTYEGGGTGFYRGGAVGRHLRQAAHERADAARQPPYCGAEPPTEPPSLTLRPAAAGSALLFSGNVTHEALSVVAGTRFVWVASFSARLAVDPSVLSLGVNITPRLEPVPVPVPRDVTPAATSSAKRRKRRAAQALRTHAASADTADAEASDADADADAEPA